MLICYFEENPFEPSMQNRLVMLYYALKLMEEDVASGQGAVRHPLHAVRRHEVG
jgi:hypothetical protein